MSIHTVHRAHGVYNVHWLWKLIEDETLVPTSYMDFDKLNEALESEMWTKSSDGTAFRPSELVGTRTVIDDSHWERVFKADLSFPVIVFDQNTAPEEEINGHKDPYKWAGRILGRYDCVDGLHRLSKLFLMHRNRVKVKIITWDILQKAKISDTEYMLMLLAAFFGFSIGSLMWTAKEWSKVHNRTSLNWSN